MYRHVLFDIDGTMIDSEPYYVECLNEVCRRFLGHSPAAEAVRRCFAMNSHDALHALGVGTHALSEAVALYDALCFQPDKVPVCPGIPTLPSALRRDGARLAIYSARFAYEFEQDPALTPLLPCFDEIICVGPQPSKPDPGGALDYIRRHRLAKDEVLYVGDSHIDSLTAQRAGIDLAMCEWKRLCNPQRYPARYYCSRPEQILSIWQENRRGLCMAEG